MPGKNRKCLVYLKEMASCVNYIQAWVFGYNVLVELFRVKQ